MLRARTLLEKFNNRIFSAVHGNNIAVEAQRNKLRLVVETAQEVWGTA